MVAPLQIRAALVQETFGRQLTSWSNTRRTRAHYIYIYIYMCVCADESNNGTLLAQKRVKQRDAHVLNNGMLPISHYTNSGFALFIEVAISDAGSSA